MSAQGVPETRHDEAVMDVLVAIRAFTDAMDRMHGGLKGDMDMNTSDLAALRMMVMREQRDETVTPGDVARHLHITTASTTKLLDRLTASGHIERKRHPSDGRGRVVVLTDAARAAFYRSFGERLMAMRGVADRYDDDELETIVRFLDDIADAMS
jgi:DNA-binding MarR family transcriptional regulator